MISWEGGFINQGFINHMSGLFKQHEPNPPPRLLKDNVLLDAEASHREWCETFLRQSEWPNPWDEVFDREVRQKVSAQLGRAWSKRGGGEWDGDVLPEEVANVVKNWDKSLATPLTSFLGWLTLCSTVNGSICAGSFYDWWDRAAWP